MHKKITALPEQMLQQFAAFDPLLLSQRVSCFDGLF
jgi:hypothetical protein